MNMLIQLITLSIEIRGYVRYFNLNDEFRWGGILLRVYYDKKIEI